MQPKRLSVLGVGLLGGSIGLAAKNRLSQCRVIGYAHRPETLQSALDRGAINEGYDDPCRAVQNADLVVLCTPVGMLGELLDRIVPALAPGAIVTDVGSTKRSVVAHANRAMAGSPARFVGSHPMAGSEKRGAQYAQENLFEGATCVLTPDESTDPDALLAVEAFWANLGMRTRRMSPAEHDRRVADISHLPHALAAALVAMQEGESLALAGKGFADATRIAAGDGGLWRDIFLDNRDNLRASLTRLRASLDEMLACLDAEKGDNLKAWLDAAAVKRESWGRSRRDATP
jgi:prephenate dehydrogenase